MVPQWSANLQIKRKILFHNGNYHVVVSNDFGSVSTQATSLLPLSNMDMIFCPPGTFTMGSPDNEAGQIPLTNGFFGKYEVTQAQYQTVMNGNPAGLNADPSAFKETAAPVSWEDAQVFLSRLNEIEQSAGDCPTAGNMFYPRKRSGSMPAGQARPRRTREANHFPGHYNWDGGGNDGNNSKETVNIGQFQLRHAELLRLEGLSFRCRDYHTGWFLERRRVGPAFGSSPPPNHLGPCESSQARHNNYSYRIHSRNSANPGVHKFDRSDHHGNGGYEQHGYLFTHLHSTGRRRQHRHRNRTVNGQPHRGSKCHRGDGYDLVSARHLYDG